jgi:hypothetical protein
MCVNNGCPDEGEELMKCKDGYNGILCAVCEDGYFERARECVPCEEPNVAGAVACGIMLISLVMGFIRWVVKHQHYLARVGIMAHAKIFLSFFTIVGTIDTQFGIKWPANFLDFLSWVSMTFTLDVPLFTSMFCLVKVNLYESVQGTTLLLLAVVAALGCIKLLTKSESLKKNCTFALVYVSIFAYPVVSSKVVDIFACHDVDGVPYHRADYSLACKGAENTRMKMYATVWIVGYVVALPLYLLHVLNQYRQKLERGKFNPSKETFGFLAADYRLSQVGVLWEVLEIIRKLLLSVVGAFFTSKGPMSVATSLVLALAFHLLHTEYKPYHSRTCNILQHMCLLVLSLLYFIGLLLKVHAVEAWEKEQLGNFLIALLVIVLLTAGAMVAFEVREFARRQFRRQATYGHFEGLVNETSHFGIISFPGSMQPGMFSQLADLAREGRTSIAAGFMLNGEDCANEACPGHRCDQNCKLHSWTTTDWTGLSKDQTNIFTDKGKRAQLRKRQSELGDDLEWDKENDVIEGYKDWGCEKRKCPHCQHPEQIWKKKWLQKIEEWHEYGQQGIFVTQTAATMEMGPGQTWEKEYLEANKKFRNTFTVMDLEELRSFLKQSLGATLCDVNSTLFVSHTSESVATEVEALIEMRKSIRGLRKLRGWRDLAHDSDMNDLQRLEGIEISAEGRVIGLNLEKKGLSGQIPDSIKAFECLERLKVSNNRLSGRIPDNMGSSQCLPCLEELHLENNSLEGEICMDLFRKPGVNLFVFPMKRPGRIRTPFFVGVTIASEQITATMLHVDALKLGKRTQEKVPTVSVDEPLDQQEQQEHPLHRCVLEKYGSRATVYSTWQRVWMRGLYLLAQDARTSNLPQKLFAVCHYHKDNQHRFAARVKGGQYQGVFKIKFENKAMDAELQRQKHFDDDFDPAYALGGVIATSILDWERHQILRVAEEYKPHLVVAHIDEFGQERPRPDWYKDATPEVLRETRQRYERDRMWRAEKRAADDRMVNHNTDGTGGDDFQYETNPMQASGGVRQSGNAWWSSRHTITVQSGTLGIAINESSHPPYAMQVDYLTGKGEVQQLRVSGVKAMMVVTDVNGKDMQGVSYQDVRESIRERPCKISFAEQQHGATSGVLSVSVGRSAIT